MGGLFSKPKSTPAPVPQAPPPTPTIDAARQQIVDSDRIRRRTGRGATMLTGATGDAGGMTGAKTLLGS